MSIKVGILQTGETSPQMKDGFIDYDDMFRQSFRDYDFEMTTYRVFDEVFPATPEEQQAYIITGSRFGVYEDLPWIERLSEFIRECYRTSIPMIGICFGHQILATALGGTVEKFSEGWAIGMQQYQFTDNGELSDQLAFHQDQVIEKPADAELLCTSEFCKYAGLVYGNKAMSVQAHPEFENEYVRALTNLRTESYSSELRAQALKSLEERTPSPVFIKRLGDFILENA